MLSNWYVFITIGQPFFPTFYFCLSACFSVSRGSFRPCSQTHKISSAPHAFYTSQDTCAHTASARKDSGRT